MNSHIFHFHPNGRSLVAALADQGHEVFTADLREQGRSLRKPLGKDVAYGLRELALTDFAALMRAARAQSVSRDPAIDLLGASLGGTISMIYSTQAPDALTGRLALMGSPIRWVGLHPLVKVLFGSPALAGAITLRGTRRVAGVALPALAQFAPWALKLYMNPDATDLRHAAEMLPTVEDPSRHINREIAKWMRDKDLIINGRNLSDDAAHYDHELCTVYANGDGIVLKDTALYVHHAAQRARKTLVKAGDRTLPYSHADLFVARDAERQVFAPVLAFLR
jgi:pimeloyl-ACP methyl ester carboxylesterase